MVHSILGVFEAGGLHIHHSAKSQLNIQGFSSEIRMNYNIHFTHDYMPCPRRMNGRYILCVCVAHFAGVQRWCLTDTES